MLTGSSRPGACPLPRTGVGGAPEALGDAQLICELAVLVASVARAFGNAALRCSSSGIVSWTLANGSRASFSGTPVFSSWLNTAAAMVYTRNTAPTDSRWASSIRLLADAPTTGSCRVFWRVNVL